MEDDLGEEDDEAQLADYMFAFVCNLLGQRLLKYLMYSWGMPFKLAHLLHENEAQVAKALSALEAQLLRPPVEIAVQTATEELQVFCVEALRADRGITLADVRNLERAVAPDEERAQRSPLLLELLVHLIDLLQRARSTDEIESVFTSRGFQRKPTVPKPVARCADTRTADCGWWA